MLHGLERGVTADNLIRLDHDAIEVAELFYGGGYLRDLGLAMPPGIARICGEVGEHTDLIRDNGSIWYPFGLLCHLRLR
jgi:hypothetical protein